MGKIAIFISPSAEMTDTLKASTLLPWESAKHNAELSECNKSCKLGLMAACSREKLSTPSYPLKLSLELVVL